MSVQENIAALRAQIPEGCTLIAVSKMQPLEKIKEAYAAGQRVFGENKAQEMVPKYDALPRDIQWHMIGHLQTNKVKYIAAFVTLIHSVDTLKLLEEINKQARRFNRIIPCLLQVHIAEEETKFGFLPGEMADVMAADMWKGMQNIEIRGLMGMATFTDNTEHIRREFRSLKTLFDNLATMRLPTAVTMKELSMGMSGDYQIAIKEGSTMVRVGTAIFGERNYARS